MVLLTPETILAAHGHYFIKGVVQQLLEVSRHRYKKIMRQQAMVQWCGFGAFGR
jgi:hypothetical protein